MNAVLLGATLAGHRLVGIEGGFAGLVEGRSRALDTRTLRESLHLSGTVLGTSRWAPMRTPAGVAAAVTAINRLELDRLIVVGGAGSLAATAALAAAGIGVIGIPATIDGDAPYETATIGMDSAINHGVRAIDDLRATARSLPGRAFLVETLGGDTGHLARAVAGAACCPIVLTPEEPWDPADVAARMRAELVEGYTIAIVGEGVGFAADIARTLQGFFGDRIRPTTLGHGMRGAPPSAADRRLGLLAGRTAVQIAHSETSSCDLALSHGWPPVARPISLPSR
jgi:6-phosphofructokinase 1